MTSTALNGNPTEASPHVVTETVAISTSVPLELTVLRAFDDVRRVMSRQVAGVDGVFIGYDALEFMSRPDEAPVLIVVDASLVEDCGERHAVRYRAAVADVDGRPLARAAGWTLVPHGRELATGIVPASPARISDSSW